MRAFDSLSFPLLVVAQSERRSGIALISRPFKVERARCTKKHISEICLGGSTPRAVLVTHATRWRCAPRTSSSRQFVCPIVAISVAAACELLECAPTVQAAVARITDGYPELERRFAPLTRAIGRSDAVRNTQPLLAALMVAHAASVAHLMKHG